MDLKTIKKIDKVYMWNYGIEKKDFYENLQKHRQSKQYAYATRMFTFNQSMEEVRNFFEELSEKLINFFKSLSELKKCKDQRMNKMSYLKKKSQRKNWSKWKGKKL